MSLPAPTNSSGHFFKNRTITSFRVLSQKNDGKVIGSDSLSSTATTDEWSKSDVVKTHVRFVGGKPWRDPTNFTRHVSSYSYHDGAIRRTWSSNSGIWEDISGVRFDDNPRDFNPSVMSENLGLLHTDGYNQAVVECLNKLNKNKVQLGTYLAESRESAQMLVDAGSDLLSMLNAVRRGQIGSVPKQFGLALRKGRDYYLQWNFGWKPLCADLYDMYQDVVQKTPVQPLLSASRVVKTPFDFGTTFNGRKVQVKGQHTDVCKLFASLSSSTLAGLQNHAVINPLSLTWELVPYSFVVDWFCPIGNVLSALSATAGLSFVGGYSTQIREFACDIPGTCGSVTKDVFLMDRVAHPSFPYVGFYGKQNPLNLDKLSKILGLLSQLV